jgi:predicted PurR-regulated permease PerM
MENRTVFEVNWRSLWRVAVFFAVAAAIYFARGAIGALLTAVVIALGLDPLVSWLESRKINRLFGTLAIFLLAVLFLSTLFYLIVPVVVSELGAFLEHLNRITLAVLGFGLDKNIIKNIESVLHNIFSFFSTNDVSLASAISAVLSKLALVLATILISFYLSLEKDGTEKLLKAILPDAFEKPVLTVFSRFKIKIRRWFVAQIFLSFLVGGVVAFGLWLLGVRYFLILGILAAAFEVVPIIGPVLAGAVMFLVAVADSFALGLYVLLFAFIVQQLENHVLIPIVMGKTMKLHPVLVIFSLLAGGQVAGFIGILLAVPIAVLGQETIVYVAERKSGRARLEI